MATLYSDIADTQTDALINAADRVVLNEKVLGTLRRARVKYTMTAGTDEAADDIIKLVQLPEGAVLLPQLCSARFEGDAAAALTLDIGDESDADRYANNLVLIGATNLRPVMAGLNTLGGGAAAEAETVTGVLATDMVLAQIVDNSSNNDAVLWEAKPSADAITFLFNEDPGAGLKVGWQVFRAPKTLRFDESDTRPAALDAVYALPAPTWIQATVVVCTTPVAGKELEFDIVYALRS